MSGIRNVSSSDQAKFASMHVLLVDDHPHIRSIMIGILNALGVGNITTAERGDIALSHMAKSNFDLLITDYEMPGMNGVEIAKLVRRDAKAAAPTMNFQIPILMVTSHITRQRLNEARDAGIDEILAKPFTIMAVADRLNSAINKRREFVISDGFIGPCRRRGRQTDYNGPRRRDLDLPELPALEIQQEKELAGKEALSICKLAQSPDVLSAHIGEVVIATALSIAQRAKRIREPLVDRACMSLIKYVRSATTSMLLNSQIIETHGYAIFELLDNEKSNTQLATLVTRGLEHTIKIKKSKHAA
jgi:two-component system, chemotaxis family, chemotaxis protein CheY